MISTQTDILFIEDNKDETEFAIRSLAKHSLVTKLKHIDEGAEALDSIFCRRIYKERGNVVMPRLIILDLNLPEIDGLEILRQLKADDKTKLIPVVALTSSQEENDVVESHKLGVNSYIVKPVNFELFTKAVKKIACTGRYKIPIPNHKKSDPCQS